MRKLKISTASIDLDKHQIVEGDGVCDSCGDENPALLYANVYGVTTCICCAFGCHHTERYIEPDLTPDLLVAYEMAVK